MSATVTEAATAEHGDGWTAYARALDRLLDQHAVRPDAGFVDVPVRRADGGPDVLRTFVMSSGSGAPVVFLNGTPATSAVWAPLVGELRGTRAIVVDRPGHGLTAPYDYRGVRDVRGHAVGFLESLLDALGLERAVLTGNSLGGLWSLWLAADRPERVSGVVLPGLPPGLLTDRLPPVFGLMSVPWVSAVLRRLDPPRPSATRRMFAMMGDPPERLSDAFVEAFTLGQQLPNVPGGTTRLVHHVRFPSRMPVGWGFDAEALARIRQPVLIVAGSQDFLGGLRTARRMSAAFPGCSLVEAGIGHLPWLQDPRAVAEELEAFVARCT